LLANNIVKSVCNPAVPPTQCLVKRAVLSVFIDLPYAECVCLYCGLLVCS